MPRWKHRGISVSGTRAIRGAFLVIGYVNDPVAAFPVLTSVRYPVTKSQQMKNPGWRRWSVLVAFALVVSFTGFFAVRTVRRAIYWHYHQDEPIRPWMSLGYIAHSYSVPPWVLHKALGLPNRPDRRPIRVIAREQNRSVEEVTATLQDAIVHVRPPYPPPGPPPPPDNEPTRGRSP